MTVMTTSIRKPAVSGTFYPADADKLHDMIGGFLKKAKKTDEVPKAIISPHAGYEYSGAIAASAYKPLTKVADKIKQVILFGPTHHVSFSGMAIPMVDFFETPLGKVPINRKVAAEMLRFPFVTESDEAHEKEHSLETQIPFLQEVLGDFELIPIVIGNATPQEVAMIMGSVWGEEETLIVISSDLSHYQDYESAVNHDKRTSDAILESRFAEITPHDACGSRAVNGLLYLAREMALQGKLVDLRNSGDTAGDKSRVVGYGAYHFTEDKTIKYSGRYRHALRNLARYSIAYGVKHGKILDDFHFAKDLYDETPVASFVTIERNGQLRGCIGTLEAYRPLAVDVMNNAYGAAFNDPRFPSLTEKEFPYIGIKISVLTAPEPIKFSSEEDLISKIRPGVDGLILSDGDDHRGTFLPSVWETIDTPERFLRDLKRKAGLDDEYWSDTLEVQRYTTECF